MSVDHGAASWTEACRRRAIVLAVRPEVDGGRFPVKRALGEPLAIEADIVADGHDVVRAVVLDRAPGSAPGATGWRETELVLGPDDTWRATIELAGLGRHRY
ncbi:MAG TPA: maltotransferase domain-containing protein, partial [Kofleriaceae bacterium]